MTKTVVNLLLAASVFALARPLTAEDAAMKEFVVEPNADSANMLRVSVDHADHLYKVGETMTVTVKPEKDCYLYLLYTGAGGDVHCLFPNEYQQDNRVHGGGAIQVPSADGKFQITCRPPCGTEQLVAIGTEKPLEFCPQKQLTKGGMASVKRRMLKEMQNELKDTPRRDWAEARTEITTSETGQGQSQQPRRVAVCVGISRYQSDRVPQLRVSDKDAERMAAALKNEGRCDDVILLTNAQATYAAIEKAIFQDLVRETHAGDTIFIYFSGHGGYCADTVGDKPDGLEKFLVPHDGVPGRPETMISDRTFTRWLRELDGREIGIVLDNCYSAGMAKGTGRAKGVGGLQPKGLLSDALLVRGLNRAKALGQEGVMLLAACEANQLAWEMKDEDGDDSVLTYYVMKAVKDPGADTNGDGHVSVGELFNYAKGPVKEYVQKALSAEQNPVLLNLDRDRIVVKP